MKELEELGLLITQLQKGVEIKNYCKNFKKPNELDDLDYVVPLIASIYQNVLSADEPKCFGVKLKIEDTERLINLHLSDLYKYATKENIELNGRLLFGHEYFNNGALFYLAKKTLIPSSFDNSRECESNGFDFYQIPFILRLAIENKAKSIIGYKSSKYVRSQKSCPFPTSKVIDYLINDENCILYAYEDLLNVYKWSCTFVHEAKIDYIWNIMNAIKICEPVFDNLNNQRLRGRVKPDDETDIMERLNNLHKVNFFKSDLEIRTLQDRINRSIQFKNNICFELSLEEVESSNINYE
ncbi:hypothetical protein K6U70_00055 [Vibrio vulnificus]|uniref:hypothetical protein n=1 Tax=Vibrio vulnificus TaxID=672 RepID=UPI001EEBAD79|nr:hypothetical protein [Vibrio vulnificus]MCG6270618.1 hypothetical protein [Vibrio vulnificus]